MATNRVIGFRVNERELREINEQIEKGYANTIGDYLRQAVREKISRDTGRN